MAMRVPVFNQGIREVATPQQRGISQSLSATRGNEEDMPTPWTRKPPSYRTAMMDTDQEQQIQGLWPPSGVIKTDRRKATVVWVLLVCGYIGYVVYLGVNSRDMRSNPPVKIQVKEEPFNLPDVVFCPAAGDGCDSDEPRDCAHDMRWNLAAIGGFVDGIEYLAETLAPTPAPTPAPIPELTPAPLPAASSTEDDSGGSTFTTVYLDDDRFSSSIPETPAPVVLPAIRVNVETEAYDYCPRIPLSNLTIDWEGVESGDVRSLHASVYVLWSDEVIADETPVSSARMLVNMFLVDSDREASEAVVAARLPYTRVEIDGSNEFTFLSNDVIVSLSQYIRLGANGQPGSPERTYTQVTTSGQHILRLNSFAGKEYSGALLFATFSINKFAYQSIEEVDPVDVWALLGSAGGMWEIVCVVFGLCFVAVATSGPDKKWGLNKTGDGGNRSGACKKCLCFGREANQPG